MTFTYFANGDSKINIYENFEQSLVNKVSDNNITYPKINIDPTSYSSEYLNLVGGLKLQGNSTVNGKLVINNNGKIVAGITEEGDMMLKGDLILGDNKDNLWRFSTDKDNFYIQKQGQDGFIINSSGEITKNTTKKNTWSNPKL